MTCTAASKQVCQKGTVMTSQTPKPDDTAEAKTQPRKGIASQQPEQTERGGPKGPEPTRYGDWENNGRCTDF